MVVGVENASERTVYLSVLRSLSAFRGIELAWSGACTLIAPIDGAFDALPWSFERFLSDDRLIHPRLELFEYLAISDVADPVHLKVVSEHSFHSFLSEKQITTYAVLFGLIDILLDLVHLKLCHIFSFNVSQVFVVDEDDFFECSTLNLTTCKDKKYCGNEKCYFPNQFLFLSLRPV